MLRRLPRLFLTLLCASAASAASAQTIAPASTQAAIQTASRPAPLQTRPSVRVTSRVDRGAIAMLPGTHPSVVGRATIGNRLAATRQLRHLILVLRPSEDQDTALRTLLDSQQDKGSASFHQWVTPDTFASSFGIAPADLAQVTAWLADSGLSVESVSHSGRFVTFSGTSGAVESAFNTEMHQLTVDGETHISNTTDVSIPAALAPVVRGVARLNNFFPKSSAHDAKKVTLHKNDPNLVELSQPQFGVTPTGTHYVAPGDIANIYNATPLTSAGITGKGITIAVLAQSNIRLADVQAYRSLFGLPKNDPNIIVVGSDPGENSDDVEAFLDAEFAGAVATGATVDFIVSSNSLVGGGVDAAALYAVDNNLGDVITLSYGGCETSIGASGTAFWNILWEEAAAQGQTAFVSSGDSGAATCSNSSATFATAYGVNALGSSAYNVAVGGSMFVDYNNAQYWGSTSFIPYTSALGYIPEAAWNQGRLSTTYLNSAATATVTGSGIVGGGGGISIYTARPPWQTGSGIPALTDPLPATGTGIAAGSPITGPHRLVPDLSFVAASGHDGTLFCFEGGCYENSSGGDVSAGIVGGTSVAAPVMASVQALIDSANGGRQGNANFYYYPLANSQFTASQTACQAPIGTATNPTVILPAATCNFHDIIAGSNIVPTATTGTASLGFSSGVGFDEATGLGSMNIANIAANWSSVTFRATTTSLGLTPTSAMHGSNQYAAVTVAGVSGSGTPTGDISIIASQQTATGSPQVFTLSGGNAYGLIDSLPGGTYTVHAHYGGDTTFGSSDSASVPVTIAKESSTTLLQPYLIGATGSVTVPVTFTYGSGEIYLDTEISAASGNGTPSGIVTYSVSQNGIALPGLSNQLDSFGTTYLLSGPSFATFYLVANYATLSPGAYVVRAVYPGDTSFLPNTASTAFTVVKATPTVSYTTSTAQIVAGAATQLNYTLTTPTAAAPATGTVIFTDTSTGTVLGTSTLGSSATGNGTVTLSTALITSLGAHVISAVYSGDLNYNSVTPAPVAVTVNALATSTTLLTPSTASPFVGTSVTLSATVSPIPTVAATVSFYNAGVLLGTSAVSLTTGTATLAVTTFNAATQSLTATFSGTPTVSASSASLLLNVAKNLTVVDFSGGETSTYGQTLSFNGYIVRSPTVTGVPAIPLTGTVNFYDGSTSGTLIGSATPLFGPGGNRYVATINLSTLSVGVHGITAAYTGDANYASSFSITAPATVSAGTLAINVLALSIPNATASSVLTATVAYPGPTPPTGGLLFSIDGGPAVPATCLGAVSPLTCTASYPTASLNAGTHTITATEVADSNYLMASASAALTVIASASANVQLISTSTLYSQNAGGYLVTVTVSNTGTATASNVMLTGVSAGAGVATPATVAMGSIAPGASASVTVSLPYTAGMDGDRVVLRTTGTYTGGTFGGSLRTTLP